jgi:hypothetical protein
MSGTMFYISMAILTLDLIVAVLFYSQARTSFLPRLPTSIASEIAYFASSHVISVLDCQSVIAGRVLATADYLT